MSFSGIGAPEEPAQAAAESAPAAADDFVAPELLPPNNTVYVNNINEKIKEKELRKALTAVFAEHGKVQTRTRAASAHARQIVQLTTMRSLARRGQAFVSFQKLASAEKAVAALQGFLLFGKKLVRCTRCPAAGSMCAAAQLCQARQRPRGQGQG